MLLAGDLRRDSLMDGQRVSVAKVDAEVRGIQLDVEKKEADLRLETHRSQELLRLDIEDKTWRQNNQKRLAELDAEDKEMASMVRMQIQMATSKHEREIAARRMEIESENRRMEAEITARFEERKIRFQEDQMRMSQVKDILTAGMSGGAVNADVLRTFLTESTKQSFVTTSDAKTASLFDAEKAKANLDTFKDAEDRERRQQQDMTRLSTDMMGASKQNFGPSVVIGSGVPPVPVAAPPTTTVAPAVGANDPTVRLAKLKRLYDQGLIDDDEFKQRKLAILEEI